MAEGEKKRSQKWKPGVGGKGGGKPIYYSAKETISV